MPKPFVVVSGLPCSGKSTLARRLALALDLPVIDKDDIRIGCSKPGGSGTLGGANAEP